MKQDFIILLRKTFIPFFDVVILFFIVFYLNISALFMNQFPDTDLFYGEAWQISGSLGLTTIAMLIILYVHRKIEDFLYVWRKNIWLILFIALSILSLLWTVNFSATLYELMLLCFSAFSASYLAVRYRMNGFISILSWIGACFILVNLFFVFFVPFGIMQNEPYVGSWRGIFWHRNHAGSLMAFFNTIFLARFLMDRSASRSNRVIFAFFYFLTAAHVFGSKSATGVLIYIFLNLISVVAWLWVNFHQNFKKKHYYISAFIVLMGFVIFAFNLDFFFALLGRSANLTGRIPLWQDLFNNFYLTRPILGYGYGALWMEDNFRKLMQTRHNWGYHVYFADNGFLDILLNLGAMGLGFFLMMFVQIVYQVIKKILQTYSWKYVFSFIVIIYIFIANLTFSFLLEVDHFVWACLLVLAFIVYLPCKSIEY